MTIKTIMEHLVGLRTSNFNEAAWTFLNFSFGTFSEKNIFGYHQISHQIMTFWLITQCKQRKKKGFKALWGVFRTKIVYDF